MTAIRKTRYQTFRDEVTGQDPNGNDIIASVPDKVVTEVPVGVRFSVVEAPQRDPSGGHYDGPPATLAVDVDDKFVADG